MQSDINRTDGDEGSHLAASKWFLLWTVMLPALTASGCSDGRAQVHPVSGKVTFLGQPPSGAQIVLHAVGRSAPSDITPVGVVQEDGSFTVTACEPGDGAPAGDYVATIQWFKIVSDGGGGGRGPNVLPPKYASPQTTPIRISVKEGGTEVPPIEITRR